MTEGEEFTDDNEFFKRMLNLLPPTAYFDKEVQEQLRTEKEGDEINGNEDDQSPNKRKKKSKQNKQGTNLFMSRTVTQIQEENLMKLPQTKVTEKKHKKQKKDNVTVKPSTAPTVSASDGPMDNRAKIRAKIELLQSKRGMSDETQEMKKLRRKEDQMKKKAKKMANKKKAKMERVQTDPTAKGEKAKQPKTPSKPIYNSAGNLVYSKFDFTNSGKKKQSSDLTGKDYKRLLEKIERRNEKLNILKGKDESAAVTLQEKYKWEKAFHKAEGEKVKDNPELLKKALKRKEKIKEKNKKKWDSRTKTIEKEQEAKQAKRTKNLNARKQSKKDNKMKKLQKKGRLIPGF